MGRELRQLGLTFYLPQVLKEDRTPGGRKIRSVLPLVPELPVPSTATRATASPLCVETG